MGNCLKRSEDSIHDNERKSKENVWNYDESKLDTQLSFDSYENRYPFTGKLSYDKSVLKKYDSDDEIKLDMKYDKQNKKITIVNVDEKGNKTINNYNITTHNIKIRPKTEK